MASAGGRSAAGAGGVPDAGRLKVVKDLIKKGKKQAKGSWISSKNPDEAEKTLKEAKKAARRLTPITREVYCLQLEILELLAAVQYDMNLPFDSAKSLEEASRLAVKHEDEGEGSEKALRLLRESAMYTRLNGQYEECAKKMVRAARIAGDERGDVTEALEIFTEALDMLESERRYKTCHDTFNAAIKFCTGICEWKTALEYLVRQCEVFALDMEVYDKKYFGGICSQMIIHFVLKDVKSAQRCFHEALAKFPGYADRDPSKELAERLLFVFETANDEELTAIFKSGDFGLYVPNAIEQVAKKRLNLVDITPLDPGLITHTKVEIEEMKEEMKQDMADDALVSTATAVDLDETGAPMI